jgi:hypothetical protein
VLTGFQNFTTHFLDEALFQNMTHIDDLPFLGDTQVALGILSSSCVAHRPSYLTQIVLYFSSFLSFLVGFDEKV